MNDFIKSLENNEFILFFQQKDEGDQRAILSCLSKESDIRERFIWGIPSQFYLELWTASRSSEIKRCLESSFFSVIKMQIEQLPSGYKLTYCTTSLKEIYDLFSETGKEELTELLNSHLGLLIGHSTQLESMSQRFLVSFNFQRYQ